MNSQASFECKPWSAGVSITKVHARCLRARVPVGAGISVSGACDCLCRGFSDRSSHTHNSLLSVTVKCNALSFRLGVRDACAAISAGPLSLNVDLQHWQIVQVRPGSNFHRVLNGMLAS
jgi:hypothetical protein